MKLYISRKKETPRMFQSNFVEFFSKVHWTVPMIVYTPMVLFFITYYLLKENTSAWMCALLYITGLFVWSLTEYTLHRFVFHFHPSSELGKKFFWIIHGVHHDYPSDPLRLVMPPILSIPIAIAIYSTTYYLVNNDHAYPIMAGITTGYIIYDTSHYILHHFPIKGIYWSKVREHHMRHHFDNPDLGFGVSSFLWDMVFRTNFDEKKH